MNTEIITGNKALAVRLGVGRTTIQAWRRKNLLSSAELCNCGRVIIYDLNKVFECLQQVNGKVTKGRPRKYTR